MAASLDHPTLQFVQAKSYAKGRTGPPLWIVVHDMEAGEHSSRAENTAEYFRTLPDGRSVSSHYCVDDNSVIQCVRLADTAHTTGGNPGNPRGINWELAGFARQSRAEWLDTFGRSMFAQMAPYVRADAKRFGIPLERRTIAELRAFKPGVTSHNDIREAFGGTTHTDPGPNFPWDVFMEIMRGGSTMAISDKDFQHLIWRVESEINDRPTYVGGPQKGQAVPSVRRAQADSAKLDALATALAELKAKVDALAAPEVRVTIDQGSFTPDVLALIAKAVADENHLRTAE